MSRSVMMVAVVLLSAGVAYGDWIQNPGNGHWYRLTEVEGTWAETEAEAVANGGHLVTIDDGTENQWVYDTFAPGNGVMWIGLFQDHNDSNYSEPSGGWKWVGAPDLCSWETGNPTVCYENWRSSEPNDNGDEDFVQMLTFAPGKWNDYPQNLNPYAGVIERETFPSVPTVSEWGMVAMTLLLLSAGTVVFAKRRRQKAA